ncbi:MAG: xanthine dehydrogenase family protein molybdopterin-binding subunit [Pseudorhodoplanes sp.]|uniref:xanthine dehydrogenase family protein molybdopterin-binding subunit n=1 Tax=Pseudorhodoplanes sp. TaxID=1934341 RepID=UPI003D0E81F5
MTSYIGRSVARKEDTRLLKGEGRFVADIYVADALEAVIFRSPVAHGRVKRLDLSAARSGKGVVAVYCASDIGPVGSMPTTFVPKPELERYFQRPIAADKVRYVGEPLAIIIAEDRYAAEDALELIDVEIEPLDALVDARQSRRSDQNFVHEAAGSNVAGALKAARGDIDGALRSAPARMSRSFATHRHTGIPMETRGLLAYLDPSTDVLTVWGPTKVIHRTRAILARLLEIPEDRIRCLEPDVGGAFGFRGEFFPEDFLIPWAVLQLRRPVRWIEDRQEHFLAMNHSRQQWHDVDIGFDKQGRILAFRDRAVMDMGAYIRPNGMVAPTHTITGLSGPYRIPTFDISLECVITNKTPHGSYRGPGQFESSFVRERMLDLVAGKLGIDPVQVRKANMVRPEDMPYATGTHEYGHEVIFDGGNYARALDRVLEKLDYDGARKLQSEMRSQGRYFGIGLASFVEPSGMGEREHAHIQLGREGNVQVRVGVATIGQGTQTTLAQVAAEATGASYDSVTVLPGDTDLLGVGVGSWASRAAVMGGSAVLGAGHAFRQKVLDVAALRLGVSAEDLSAADSEVWVTDRPDMRIDFAGIAKLVHAPDSNIGEIEAFFTFEQSNATFPFGSAAALVEVDILTGAVRILKYVIVSDVGTVINPTIVKGQLVGAAAQGIGGALLEELVYDEQGQLLTTTFADYLVPTAIEMPDEIIVEILEESKSPTNPLGAKGAGEAGIVPAAAVLSNAVSDALKPLGVEITSLPLSHDRLRSLIREKQPQ